MSTVFPYSVARTYVELGGTVTRVKSYGELVTAIINPSHKLADGYAEDLVMFLQPHYEVLVPAFKYRHYPLGL